MADKKTGNNGKFQFPDEYKIKRHSIKVFIDGGNKRYDLGFVDSHDSAKNKEISP